MGSWFSRKREADWKMEEQVGREGVLANLKLLFPGHPDELYNELLTRAETAEERVLDPYPSDWATDTMVDILAALPDPNPIVAEDVFIQIMALFPRVDTEWVRGQVGKGKGVEELADFIADPENKVPKAPKTPKPVKRKSSEMKKPVKIVEVDFLKEPYPLQDDKLYVKAAEKLLGQLLPELSLLSTRAVLRAFGNNFPPALRAILDEQETVAWKNAHEDALSIPTSKPLHPTMGLREAKPAVTELKRLKKKRRLIPEEELVIPPFLDAQLRWLKTHHPHLVPKLQQDVTEPVEEREELIECEICCDEKTVERFRACLDGHLFCMDCILNQAREAAYGQGTLKCLDHGCKLAFSRDTLSEVLPEDMRETLEAREQDQAVGSAGVEGLVRCRFCAWAVVLETEPGVDKVFHCGLDPEHDFCRLCERLWDDEHIGRRCDELKVDEETAKRIKLEEALTDAILRKCHKCALQFQKVEGCNKMTCNCKATSCYLCKKPDIHYSHFCSHYRDPGKGCTQCGKCSLWEKPERMDAARILKVEAELNQENKLAEESEPKDVPQENAADPPMALGAFVYNLRQREVV